MSEYPALIVVLSFIAVLFVDGNVALSGLDGGFDFHLSLLGFVRGRALFVDGNAALSGLDGGFDFHLSLLGFVKGEPYS